MVGKYVSGYFRYDHHHHTLFIIHNKNPLSIEILQIRGSWIPQIQSKVTQWKDQGNFPGKSNNMEENGIIIITFNV